MIDFWQPGADLILQALAQPWWPRIPVALATVGEPLDRVTRYVAIPDSGDPVVLTDSADAFNRMAERERPLPVTDEELFAYGLFYLEVTRALDAPAEVLAPGLPYDVPAWAVAGEAMSLPAAPQLEVWRRLARLGDRAVVEAARVLEQVCADPCNDALTVWFLDAGFTEAEVVLLDRARRLPVTSLDSEALLLLARAHRMVPPANSLRAAKWVDEPPHDWIAGELVDERTLRTERGPHGWIVRVEAAEGFLVSVPLQGLEAVGAPAPGDGFISFTAGLPRAGAPGRYAAPGGGRLPLVEGTELYRVDAGGEASLVGVRAADGTWRRGGPAPTAAVEAWPYEAWLMDVTAGPTLPCVVETAEGRLVRCLVGAGESVWLSEIRVDTEGRVAEDRLLLI